MNEREAESKWEKTKASNLVRYVPSGKYFARVRVGGKLILKSLKTTAFTVAQTRLADLVSQKRKEIASIDRAAGGKMMFADALKIYEARFEASAKIKEGAKVYRRKCVKALLASWPMLAKLDVRKISKSECITWAKNFAAEYSPSVYNNTVGTLRGILDVAIECGALYSNPANDITKRKPSVKKLVLPSREQFDALLSTVENAGAWCSRDCADLIRFLAYGGFRITEAAHIVWDDCDFTKGQIHVRVTKNGEARYVPMISEMRQTLTRMRAARMQEPPTEGVMRVHECQKAIENAAAKIGMARITHHDLRHLFATRCIESGVDIPTVSRWLGHKDGGALAMKVYGHLTNEHSAAMAQKVSFAAPEKKEAA